MVTSNIRGNIIYYINNKWYYEDGINIEDDPNRPCIRCGKPPTKEGYGACLGFVPGLKSACCGHGVTNPIRIREKK